MMNKFHPRVNAFTRILSLYIRDTLFNNDKAPEYPIRGISVVQAPINVGLYFSIDCDEDERIIITVTRHWDEMDEGEMLKILDGPLRKRLFRLVKVMGEDSYE
tara:strand:+ start:2137 stop:2445 length:309 start_codon:yes stop_codon:yes gene_type:complete